MISWAVCSYDNNTNLGEIIENGPFINYLCTWEGGFKIRSHAHAVTDWIYCPEPLGSPWPTAVGCPGVLFY